MPRRTPNPSGHLHKKRRPVSIISAKEAFLSSTPHPDDSFPEKIKGGITWGTKRASLPYHEEEYSHAIIIPHPHYRPTPPEKGYEPLPDSLYGVPVLGDQVDFGHGHDSQNKAPAEQSRRRRSFRDVFGKVVGKQEDFQDRAVTGMSYPAELVGMTVADKQNLSEQARQHETAFSQMLNEHHHDYHHHRPMKSVTWDPELGSVTTSSSSTEIPDTKQRSSSTVRPSLNTAAAASSAGSIDSAGSDKTVWPFPRTPISLSRCRKGPPVSLSTAGTNDGEADVEAIGSEEATGFNGFEFTPRTYIPLWTPEKEGGMSTLSQSGTATPPSFALPSTPPAQLSRHRRTFSICKPQWRAPPIASISTYPPAFMDTQLSPLATHTQSSSGYALSWPPTLPAFGGPAKIYTPPSPFEHSASSLSQYQEWHEDLGNSGNKWSRVDFGNGDGASGGGRDTASPSRTLM
ncbi:hypothetical protein QFC19_001338 [Naganishia cerealis]|uniref:Uncharacterized protein n=1 Tax=Naganishia cerealis TaxID=610337 RepID=A0ACC2WIU5_9TREE|nr:hypothetical protein QFC19_001338 [Naganishia cerealis]